MNGPTDEYRASIFTDLEEIPTVQDQVRVVTPEIEDQLDSVLIQIYRDVSREVETSNLLRANEIGEEDAYALLTAIDQWASVASYAVAWVYAPQSPSPKRLAGWAARIADYLRRIADVLRNALATAARCLRAASWSIGVSFPWGSPSA